MTTSVPTHRMCSEEHGGAMFAGQHCPSPVCVAERTPASPVDAVTEAWPRPPLEPYGDDPDVIRESCAFEQHVPWTTTGDKFHGVIQTCACGDRLYDLTDTEIPK